MDGRGASPSLIVHVIEPSGVASVPDGAPALVAVTLIVPPTATPLAGRAGATWVTATGVERPAVEADAPPTVAIQLVTVRTATGMTSFNPFFTRQQLLHREANSRRGRFDDGAREFCDMRQHRVLRHQ